MADSKKIFSLFFKEDGKTELGGFNLPMTVEEVLKLFPDTPDRKLFYLLKFNEQINEEFKLARSFYFYKPPLVKKIELSLSTKNLAFDKDSLFEQIHAQIKSYLTNRFGKPVTESRGLGTKELIWDTMLENQEVSYSILQFEDVTPGGTERVLNVYFRVF